MTNITHGFIESRIINTHNSLVRYEDIESIDYIEKNVYYHRGITLSRNKDKTQGPLTGKKTF